MSQLKQKSVVCSTLLSGYLGRSGHLPRLYVKYYLVRRSDTYRTKGCAEAANSTPHSPHPIKSERTDHRIQNTTIYVPLHLSTCTFIQFARLYRGLSVTVALIWVHSHGSALFCAGLLFWWCWKRDKKGCCWCTDTFMYSSNVWAFTTFPPPAPRSSTKRSHHKTREQLGFVYPHILYLRQKFYASS